jgi:hypothetical protein
MRNTALALLFAAAGLILLAQEPGSRSAEKKAAMMKKREGRLKPGDHAPNFTLKLAKSEETVRLASFEGKKAVALVFGSYT